MQILLKISSISWLILSYDETNELFTLLIIGSPFILNNYSIPQGILSFLFWDHEMIYIILLCSEGLYYTFGGIFWVDYRSSPPPPLP